MRIVAALFVVILHYNNSNIGAALVYAEGTGITENMLLVLEYLCIGAVDIFIIITGYFQCTSAKRSLLKVGDLLFQVSVMNAIKYIVFPILSGNYANKSILYIMKILLPANYFVILYCVLYLISPYINLIIDSLTEIQLKKFTGLVMLLFSVYPSLVDAVGELTIPLTGFSSISAFGSDWGYTIVNFCLMYIIGATIRKLNVKIKMRWTIMIIVCCTLGLLVMRTICRNTSESYCNPLVVLNAVSFFLLFKEFKVKNRVINELAGASFVCYLFHEQIIEYFNVEKAIAVGPIHTLLQVLAICLLAYISSYILFKMYDIVMVLLKAKVSTMKEKIKHFKKV